VLSVSGPTLVLWVHLVAACIWIGGQVTVAAIIPLLRDQRELARRVGRRYQAVAWPAFAVLIVTGVVNVGNAGLHWSQLLDSSAGRTLVVKLVLVALSGLAAGVHSFLQAPRRGHAGDSSAVGSAVLGSISLVAALLAALYGVAIAGA
jgi:putative copper export protein